MTTPSPDTALIEEARTLASQAPELLRGGQIVSLITRLADALSRRGGMEITGRQVFDAFRAEWPKLVEWDRQGEYQASYERVAKALTPPASSSGEG